MSRFGGARANVGSRFEAAQDVLDTLGQASYAGTADPTSKYGRAQGLSIYGPTYGFDESYCGAQSPWREELAPWTKFIRSK